jgi:hypothetical protein
MFFQKVNLNLHKIKKAVAKATALKIGKLTQPIISFRH